MSCTLSFEPSAEALREIGLINRTLAVARLAAERRDVPRDKPAINWKAYCSIADLLLSIGESMFEGSTEETLSP